MHCATQSGVNVDKMLTQTNMAGHPVPVSGLASQSRPAAADPDCSQPAGEYGSYCIQNKWRTPQWKAGGPRHRDTDTQTMTTTIPSANQNKGQHVISRILNQKTDRAEAWLFGSCDTSQPPVNKCVPSSPQLRQDEDNSDSSSVSSSPPSSPSSYCSTSSSSSSVSSDEFVEERPRFGFQTSNLSDTSSAPSSPECQETSTRHAFSHLFQDRCAFETTVIHNSTCSSNAERLIENGHNDVNSKDNSRWHRPSVSYDHICENGPDLSESSSSSDEENIENQQNEWVTECQDERSDSVGECRPPLDKAAYEDSELHNDTSEVSECKQSSIAMEPTDCLQTSGTMTVQVEHSQTVSAEVCDQDNCQTVIDCTTDVNEVPFELEQYGIGFQEEILGEDVSDQDTLKEDCVRIDPSLDMVDHTVDSSSDSDSYNKDIDQTEVSRLSFGLSASPPSPEDHVIIDGHVICDDDHVIIDGTVVGDSEVMEVAAHEIDVSEASHADTSQVEDSIILSQDTTMDMIQSSGIEEHVSTAQRSPRCSGTDCEVSTPEHLAGHVSSAPHEDSTPSLPPGGPLSPPSTDSNCLAGNSPMWEHVVINSDPDNNNSESADSDHSVEGPEANQSGDRLDENEQDESNSACDRSEQSVDPGDSVSSQTGGDPGGDPGGSGISHSTACCTVDGAEIIEREANIPEAENVRMIESNLDSRHQADIRADILQPQTVHECSDREGSHQLTTGSRDLSESLTDCDVSSQDPIPNIPTDLSDEYTIVCDMDTPAISDVMGDCCADDKSDTSVSEGSGSPLDPDRMEDSVLYESATDDRPIDVISNRNLHSDLISTDNNGTATDIIIDKQTVDKMAEQAASRSKVPRQTEITPILQRFYSTLLDQGEKAEERSGHWVKAEASSDMESYGSVAANSDMYRMDVEGCETCSSTDEYEDGMTTRTRKEASPPTSTTNVWESVLQADDGRVRTESGLPAGVWRRGPSLQRHLSVLELDLQGHCTSNVVECSSQQADIIPSPCQEVVSTCHTSPPGYCHSSSSLDPDRPGRLTLKICRRRNSHVVRFLDAVVSESWGHQKKVETDSSSYRASQRLRARIETLNRNSGKGRKVKLCTRQAKLAMKPAVVLHRLGAGICLKCLRRQHQLKSDNNTGWSTAARHKTDTNMVRPVRRRKALPATAINLWTAIRYIRQQKQIPNLDRISRYMQREHSLSPSETDLQLKYAVEDHLIVSYTAVSLKGSKVGMEQEGFKVPEADDEEFERDGHDWYCFDCHQPGEVVLCSECWRVYHPTCTEEEWTGSKFVCSVCKNIKKQPRMKRKEINRLLAYTILRLKEKTKELHSFGGKEDELKVERFIYKYVDLNVMEEKTKERKYKYLEQFYSDARTILHNTFICYGENGNMANLAKIMIRDCKYDLDEIRQCKDCYHYSNAKPKDWFCQPCRPPHQLVYAKQKGFCFWPAKVIKVTEEGYDVRFFGGWHQRAILPENCIKPIDASMKSLTIKRTAGFVKAMNELKRHQDLIDRMSKDTEAGDNSDMEADEEEELEQPEIKHKKFRHHAKRPREEELVISSSHVPDKAQAPTPEDVNMVTSSEDNVQTPRTFSTSDVGVQTSKKLIHPGKQPHKATQTDAEVASVSCNCDVRYAKIFNDFKERLEDNHKEDKEKALKELEERLRKDIEAQRADVLSHGSSVTQKELDQVRQITEDRCKEQYLEEIKKLTQKHKSEISATKKKQWCYNCEEEAMYHCCWNTSYCSIKCQQEHWHREHKRMCRRKRN